MSTPYVNGSRYEIGRRKTGSDLRGKKRPQRKIIGKRKKLENVCASKISLTETAVNSPRNVETTAIAITAGTRATHEISERS